MMQRLLHSKTDPLAVVVGAVCDRPRATAGRPYGFFCEFSAYFATGSASPVEAIAEIVPKCLLTRDW